MGFETRGSVEPCPTSAGTLGRLVYYRLRASRKLPIFSIFDHSDPLSREREIRLRERLGGMLADSAGRLAEKKAQFRATAKRHGTLTRYSTGCRCAKCRRAYAKFRRKCRYWGAET